MSDGIAILPVKGLPEVGGGACLSTLVVDALHASGTALQQGDVLVLTHKIVAKAEGAVIDLRTVQPSPLALRYAERWGKDPRQVEVVLQQSTRIVRMDRGVLITETHHGFICANAGVDLSNSAGDDLVCTLPLDPDASAARLHDKLLAAIGQRIAIVISDTFGRPWREGLTNVAIGVAGLQPLRDYVGMPDANGRVLQVSKLAVADELAAAAELVMGKLDRVPAAVVRGYRYDPGQGSARQLLRRPELDFFRY